MQAMLFDGVGRHLRLAEVPVPVPGPDEVLIRVSACGEANAALNDLRSGSVRGAVVLRV